MTDPLSSSTANACFVPGLRISFCAQTDIAGFASWRHRRRSGLHGIGVTAWTRLNYTTNVLLADGRPWFKSAASLRIFQLLGWPWALLSAGWLVPCALRDELYDIVARHRLRWFGVRETCYLPDPTQADRFLG